jgi:SAM-dependent methyltransferase
MAAGPGENLRTWVVGSILLGVLLGAVGAMATFLVLRRRTAVGANALHQRKARVNSLFATCDFYTRGFVRWKLRLDRVFELLAAADLGRGRVVDLGCGQGITLAFIAVENPQRPLMGCDLSAKRIDTARRALAAHNPSLSVADVRDCRFADAGLILIMDVLQYLDPGDQAALLERCAAALVPGGKLIFRVHDRQSGLPSRLALLLDRLVFLAGGVRRRPAVLPASSYREMLARTGLGVREHGFRNRLPLAHILFIAEKPGTEGAGV